MEELKVVAKTELSEQWQEWMEALVAADFEIRKLTPDHFESPPYDPLPGKIFIVDGMLPDLTMIALGIVSQCPDAHIIVATECDSFTIYYEAMQIGAVYLPDSKSPEHFVKAVQREVRKKRRLSYRKMQPISS